MSDVIVIGGGAAGMLSAALTAERGLGVRLLERGETGHKLRITGKGRCNLTNDCSVREVLENVPRSGKFLTSAMYGFPPSAAMELFEGIGVPLKTERGNRVFPVSDKAGDVVDALRRYMRRAGVEVTRGRVSEILTDGGEVTGVRVGGEVLPCRAAILATGGLSYPLTGSTGDGYDMAKKLGHTIVPCAPSLVPLVADGDSLADCAAMQGLALRNVRVTVFGGGAKPKSKPIFDDFGELLFTHFGVSGPLVLSASAHMRDWASTRYRLHIDMKPALDDATLDARIVRDFQKFQNRDFQNALGELAPRLMIPVIIARSGIPPETKTHSVTREQRQSLLQTLKCFHVDIARPRPIDEAVITSGGVETREVNPTTMESKLIKNLHFAGEILDADAYTGGFNLQIAWATAFAAAKHIL
ncbi:MAG: NAD(P)/FAD-dependent oxidoreductase [Oscillospiraceae bacterium]|jgi:predicted Rossmann fold flavoprotein|nr:NAD(P)/FAD-dependent oxidoreductase [Oscillospiraceae bacterium]